MLKAFIFLLINLIAVAVAIIPTAVVHTTSGPVRGQILKTVVNATKYAAFTGIRFGEPPVGYLRFKPPVPAKPWTKVFDATSPGNECPQLDIITDVYKGDEDCLFLSVYSTVTDLEKPPKKLKSVMVWIYGGAFKTGSQSDTKFYADYLLERDIVYVAANYRLGALGFLSLRHRNATGNAGLKDQVLALKWVKANIEKFGGNPNNVTIFGESAGAVSVGFHVLSEASKGLFHGAISMSGTPLVHWGFTQRESAVSRAYTLGMSLGDYSLNKNTLLQTFYAASAKELVQRTIDVGPATPFTPTLEDESIATDVFISECSVNKYNTGNFTKVPQMLGFMEHETAAFLGHVFGSAADLVAYFGGSALDYTISKTTNLAFKAPIDITQRLLAARNGDKPIYYYDFTFARKTSVHNIVNDIEVIGAAHGDDLAYVFYVPLVNPNHDPDHPMAITIHRVSTMWTNFAKYGNPTPHWVDEYPLNITWPPSGCDGKALNIGDDLKVVPRPIDANAEAIENANNLILRVQHGCTSGTDTPICV